MNRPVVRITQRLRCFNCKEPELVLWQGDCGCMVTMCRLCLDVGLVSCGITAYEHYEAFDIEADRLA